MSDKIYEFSGIATVSVTCRIEASTEREARDKLECGECEWVCDTVDGDVEQIELIGEEE